jgi:deoxyxylulose-5-phosphate synthase
MAVPDAFIEHGGQAELLKQLGLDASGVVARVHRAVGDTESMPQPATQPGS